MESGTATERVMAVLDLGDCDALRPRFTALTTKEHTRRNNKEGMDRQACVQPKQAKDPSIQTCMPPCTMLSQYMGKFQIQAKGFGNHMFPALPDPPSARAFVSFPCGNQALRANLLAFSFLNSSAWSFRFTFSETHKVTIVKTRAKTGKSKAGKTSPHPHESRDSMLSEASSTKSSFKSLEYHACHPVNKGKIREAQN